MPRIMNVRPWLHSDRQEAGTIAAMAHIVLVMASIAMNARYGILDLGNGLSITWGVFLGTFLWTSWLGVRLLSDSRTSLGVSVIAALLVAGVLPALALPVIAWQIGGTLMVWLAHRALRAQGWVRAYLGAATVGQFGPPILYLTITHVSDPGLLVGTLLIKLLTLPIVGVGLLVAHLVTVPIMEDPA